MSFQGVKVKVTRAHKLGHECVITARMVVRDYSDMTRKSRKQRRHLILMLMYMDQTSWTQNHRSRSELKMQNLTYWLCQHLLSR